MASTNCFSATLIPHIFKTMTSNVNELLEKLTKAQEKTQEQIALLQWEVTCSQEESMKRIVRKLDDRRKLSFKKVGNKKQFHFNQSLEQHLDTAQHELSKLDTSSMNEEVKKTIEAAREELKEGQQEVMARQKCIHLADCSEYGWATVEAYDDNELGREPSRWKEDGGCGKGGSTKSYQEKESQGEGQLSGGDFRKRLFGDQVPATNLGRSKLPELRPHPLGPCWGCGGFGHIVANCPQPPKWYPHESDDVYICDDLYVCNAVHVPDPLTSSIVGSAINNQDAVNKEDLVTKDSTDLIAGPSHLFYYQLDCLRKSEWGWLRASKNGWDPLQWNNSSRHIWGSAAP